VAVSDIGYFAAQAFLNLEEYRNKEIALAGDEVTFDGLNKAFEEETGLPIPQTYGFVGRGVLYALGDVGKMFKWFNDVGFCTDILALKKVHPGLMTVRDG
jgi:hypothetical protein